MLTEQDLIARIDTLLPAIASEAAKTDQNRRVSDEIIQALTDAGAFATIAPRVYGGHEFGLEVFSSIVQRISAVSPSTGWVTAFLMGGSWRMLAFSRQAQEEMYGEHNYVIGAGSAQPIMGVRRVEGGYVLTGRTSWNSGSSHAEWFTMSGVLMEDGKDPDVLMFAMPRSDVSVIDNWHIMGMQGTASCDLSVENLFVPDYRATPAMPAMAGQSAGHALHDNPMYRIPFIPFAMMEVMPVIVGTHRGAANALLQRTKDRIGTISGANATNKVPAQIRLAKTLSRATAAERSLADMVARNMAGRTDQGEPINRAEMKLHASMLTENCLDSVNEMARGVGGDAFRDGAPFQRYFRDLNVVARHAFLDSETAAETYGKLVLGLPITDPLI